MSETKAALPVCPVETTLTLIGDKLQKSSHDPEKSESWELSFVQMILENLPDTQPTLSLSATAFQPFSAVATSGKVLPGAEVVTRSY